MSSTDYTIIEGTVIAETDKAVCLQRDDDEDIWIPRSVIDGGDAMEEQDTDPLVADWFIDKEGL